MKIHQTTFLLAALLLAGCGGGRDADRGWSDAVEIETLVVSDVSTPSERNYVGSIGSEQEIDMSFPLGGMLTKIAVKNGDRVTKDQLLAEIDATSAASLHASSLATLRQAEDAWRRLEAVHREGGISEVKWIEMETDLEKARQAEVAARKQLKDCTLRAPFSGVVSCGSRNVGQEMKPGEVFCRVLDMRKMQVQFSVPEQEISLIAVGDTATATISALGDRKLIVRISDKSLTANLLGHTYKVYATIISGDVKNLLPDMVATVKAHLSSAGGIVVPSHCVQTTPDGAAVWVVENGHAHQRSIVVGDFIRNGVVVTGGLDDGDTVVTAGYQKLYSGAKVKTKPTNLNS